MASSPSDIMEDAKTLVALQGGQPQRRSSSRVKRKNSLIGDVANDDSDEEVSLHGKTRDQFLEDPPSRVVQIPVDFDFHRMAFVITNPIHTHLKLADLAPDGQADIHARLRNFQEHEDQNAKETRHVLILCASGAFTAQLLCVNTSPVHLYRLTSREETCDLIDIRGCLSQDYCRHCWNREAVPKFYQQLQDLHKRDETNFLSFLLAAYGAKTDTPRYHTHALFVHLELGFQLGSIAKLSRFELKTKDEARKLIERKQDPRNMLKNLLAEPKDNKTYLPVFYITDRKPMVLLEVGSHWWDSTKAPRETPQPTLRQCDRTALECFLKMRSLVATPKAGPSARGDDVASELIQVMKGVVDGSAYRS